VLDIGCGEGSLLSVLCEPTLSLPPEIPSDPEKTLDIYVSHIAGIDISTRDLEYAVQETAPPPPPILSDDAHEAINRWMKALPRWLELKVDIWKGGLEILNDSCSCHDDDATATQDDGCHFGRKEWGAIVSTEVCVVSVPCFISLQLFRDDKLIYFARLM